MTETFKICLVCGTLFERASRQNGVWNKMKYCSRQCVYRNQTLRSLHGSPSEVFESFVDRSPHPKGCWIWRGSRESDGYGRFHHGGVRYRAHVFSLEIDGRPVGLGQYACHHCDNPTCVRPDHLYPGTQAQNIKDAIERGRFKAGSAAGGRRGVDNGRTKLTEAQVRQIRGCPGIGPAAISRKFGISASHASKILNGKSWSYLA